MYRLSEILIEFNQVKTYIKLLYYITQYEFNHALKKSNIFKMAELIFQEVWWEPKSISICYIKMFSILWNQLNVTDKLEVPQYIV